jgi:hypothetical protein
MLWWINAIKEVVVKLERTTTQQATMSDGLGSGAFGDLALRGERRTLRLTAYRVMSTHKMCIALSVCRLED